MLINHPVICIFVFCRPGEQIFHRFFIFLNKCVTFAVLFQDVFLSGPWGRDPPQTLKVKMAVKIRLARRGRKKRAMYDVVVADARAPRDGRFIEKIGTYNPNVDPAAINIDNDRAFDWVMKGAQPTDTVKAMLSYRGVMLRKHLQIGVIKGALTQEQADAKLAEWVAGKEAQITGKVESLAKAKEDAKKAKLEAEAKVKEARAEALAAKAAEEEAANAAAEAEANAEEAAAEEGEEATEEAPAADEAPASEEEKTEE